MVLLLIGVEVAEDAKFKSIDLHLVALILPELLVDVQVFWHA